MKKRFKAGNRQRPSASRRTPWISYQIRSHHQVVKQSQIRDMKKRLRIKQRHQFWFNLVTIFLELVLVILGGLYLASPLNQISRVKVNGVQTLSVPEFSRELGLVRNRSLVHWVLNSVRYKKLVTRHNPQLKSIHWGLSRWNQVNVRVAEYRKIAYLDRHGKYYAVTNHNHRIGNRVYHFIDSSSVPVLLGFRPGHQLGRFVDRYQAIPVGVRNDVNKVIYEPTPSDPERVRLFMNDGNQVLIKIGSLSTKLKYYPPISRSMKKNGVVNLEVGAYSYPFNHKHRK